MKRYAAERGIHHMHEEGPECDDLCTRLYLAAEVDPLIRNHEMKIKEQELALRNVLEAIERGALIERRSIIHGHIQHLLGDI